MSKKLLLGIIVILLITNVATLFFWNKGGEKVVLDDGKKAVNAKEPVATVDGETISYDAWMSKLRAEHGKEQLKRMVDSEIVDKLADKKGIEISDKVIKRELALLNGSQGPMTPKEAKQKEKEWRKDIIYRYQLGALLTMDTSVPEEKMKSYYDVYKNQYNFTASIKVSHIIVRNMKTAEKVEKELDNGASFSLLAKEYSIDEDTKKDGGYLGYFQTNSQFLPTGYVDTAKKMEEGTYSEPFKSDTGVAIIFLHRMLPDINFTYKEIKPYLKRELAMDKLDQSLTTEPLWNKLDIEWIYDEDEE
ncbi:protein secretion protein [Virgibacillus phasianinus]|uniref:peptidylprolyl isomerase n=1 Tax=Virgibacillus phasianinus TaxID=2017483 RepID=A0A220U0V0_9BACI|nr:peptidylprolyl isomerase [Virgibacillus phasianinus]ASK61689.1 protein secretion protein [Virgibacillus phasianinus]